MKDNILQNNNKESGELVSQHITTMEFSSGPLPQPHILEKYNQIIPNAAERILVMAEKQSQHRRELEVKVTRADIRDGGLGIICGLIIGLAGMVAAVIISLYGQPIVGGIMGIGTLVSLVEIFVIGSRQKREEIKKYR